MTTNDKIKISQAIIVEGRDDVDAVSKACDALIIPTHGYGIASETWHVIDKAYAEKGIIIMTDPDLAGERIRKRLTEKYPDAIQCFLSREEAVSGDDIGIENAAPAAIKEAILKALENSGRITDMPEMAEDQAVSSTDLIRLGLTGTEGASELRAAVCRDLGIGYGNAKSMISKLRGFGINKDELEKTVIRIRQK